MNRNVKIVNMIRDKIIDNNEDSYKQTLADFEIIEDNMFYKHYRVSNITVPLNYKYLELYNEIEKMI